MNIFDKIIINTTDQIIKGVNPYISYEQALQLARLCEKDSIDILFGAHKIRQKYKKKNGFTCSIINAKSGACSENCAFCAQSSYHKTGVSTYPLLEKDKLVDSAISLDKAGATRYSMVTSGFRLTAEEIERISQTATTITEKTDLTLCTSPGTLTESMAERLKEGGITIYHHNLETAGSYFDRICTTHTYDDDIETIKLAKSAGLKVCSGGILGMGETWEQRAELAFTLRELDVDSIPINFLNPIPGTRLEAMPLLQPMEALKCIALFRFINPEKDITICGGREVTLGDYQSWIFMAGANGLMVGDYLTTLGRNIETDMDMFRKMGLQHETN